VVLAHSCVICIGIYRIVCYLSSEALVRSKVVFSLARSVCPKLQIFPNSLVKLAWLHKLLRHTKPQTYDISLSLMPPPRLSLTWREAGNVFSRLCHQRSTHCVPEHVSSVSEVPRTCYSSVSEVPRTCYSSVSEVPRTCWKRVRSSKKMLVACQKFQEHVIVACQKFQEHVSSAPEVPRTC